MRSSKLLFFILIEIKALQQNTEGTEQSRCAEGWIELEETCVITGDPIKAASWFHLQNECDAIGGFLPELASASQVEIFNDILRSYNDLVGPSLVYLGGTDLGHEQNWRWVVSEEPIGNGNNWATGSPDNSTNNNKDCLVLNSTTSLWTDTNCEEDNQEGSQVAFICMYVPAPPPGSCSEGWQKFESSCYQLVRSERTWPQANASCAGLSPPSHLVSIQTEEENAFVSNLAGGPHEVFWTGGFREPGGPVDGPWTWKWSDGSQWGYENWFKGQPDNAHFDDYYVFGNDGSFAGWGDWAIVKSLFFICEYEV